MFSILGANTYDRAYADNLADNLRFALILRAFTLRGRLAAMAGAESGFNLARVWDSREVPNQWAADSLANRHWRGLFRTCCIARPRVCHRQATR